MWGINQNSHSQMVAEAGRALKLLALHSSSERNSSVARLLEHLHTFIYDSLVDESVVSAAGDA